MPSAQLPDSNGHRLTAIAHLMSDVGRIRAANEDTCAVSSADGTQTDWQGPLDCNGGWALVADGLGGHAAGEVASALAVAILRPMMPNLRTDGDIHAAISAVDTALYLAMEQYPGLRGMGTTIAGVVMAGDHAVMFNVGDSRISADGGMGLKQLSTDDVVEGNLLTQCLGGAQEQISLAPHIVRLPLKSVGTLLLASDGLSDMLSEDDISRILNSGPANPAAMLVEAALEAGGHDNVSVIVIEPSKNEVQLNDLCGRAIHRA